MSAFDPAELLHAIVVVSEYVDSKGKLRRPLLTQYGLVKKVEGSTLTIALKMGTAQPDLVIEKDFADKGWRLAFPPKEATK